MSASKRSMPASRASDGFATLTADMMERGGGTPPPLVEASPDAEQSSGTAHASLRPPAPDAKPAFGKRAKPNRAPTRTKRTGRAAQSVQEPHVRSRNILTKRSMLAQNAENATSARWLRDVAPCRRG